MRIALHRRAISCRSGRAASGPLDLEQCVEPPSVLTIRALRVARPQFQFCNCKQTIHIGERRTLEAIKLPSVES